MKGMIHDSVIFQVDSSLKLLEPKLNFKVEEIKDLISQLEQKLLLET